MAKTVVSVIVPSYNRYDALSVCIESLLAQEKTKGVEIEIIVINDGSTDPRYKQEGAFPDGITVIHLGRNTKKVLGIISPGFVRNCGIRMCRGDYVAFCDDDDAFYPSKIRKQLAFMREHKALFSSTDVMYGNGSYPGRSTPTLFNGGIHANRFGRIPMRINHTRLEAHNVLITSATMVHKSILNRVGLFNETKELGGEERFYEDWDLWLRITKITDVYYMHEPLSYYDAEHGGGQNYICT